MRILLIFLLSIALGQVEFTSSDIPIVVLNTNGLGIPMDNPRIVADMGIIFNGPGQRNNVTDDHNNFQGKVSIEIRGASSAGWLKKSFSFETQNDDGSNRNVSLLGMPAENDWILYAPYYDRSLIRNALIYGLSRDMGRYASRTRFCELVINGEYLGVYILMEKIKRDNNRVDINRLDPDENEGEDVSGGYIIKIDKPGDMYFTSPYDPYRDASPQQVIQYQYHYPQDNVITAEQKAYISDYVNKFEDEFAFARYEGVKYDYQQYIDLDSFIDHFILNEISKNVDGYRLSAFLYKDQNSTMHAGPIWDFNFSFGNVGYYHAWDTENWQLDDFLNDALGDRWLAPFWWYVLKEDSTFIFALSTRWRELQTDILNPDRVDRYIDAMVDTLAEARVRNFEIWFGPGEPKPRNERGWFPPSSPVMHVESYDDEIAFMKNWYRARIRWMDSIIPNPPGYRYNTEVEQPFEFVLYGNYPNPFNGKTHIEFYVPVEGMVRVDIFNILGQPIATIADKQYHTGLHFVSWDGNDKQNRRMASGVYIARVKYENQLFNHKLIYIK
jgi:hypothetical protein